MNPKVVERLTVADAVELIPSHLRGCHLAVVDRARRSNAHGLILTGSTVRMRRTEISDLDYHLIGQPMVTADLPTEARPARALSRRAPRSHPGRR